MNPKNSRFSIFCWNGWAGNKMATVALSILAAAAAVLHIHAAYWGPPWHSYVFKPLATVLILIIAVLPCRTAVPLYRRWVVAGLVFSLAGDIILMLPFNLFLHGLASFLFAHLFYIAAFRSGTRTVLSPWPALPFLAYGLVIFGLLIPWLGNLRFAVAVYMLVILTMAWQALARWLQKRDKAALLACFGALLFVVSDTLLAFDHFKGRFQSSVLLYMGTYYAAQWLISLSVRFNRADGLPDSPLGVHKGH
jgi:uncharacterized membrane protein YhhN